ncbi:MAG: hypothetical protein K2P78_01860, partial [Gemmataceae bacterium]|nr:hypothetical protein [Gemmataceae bacterium]
MATTGGGTGLDDDDIRIGIPGARPAGFATSHRPPPAAVPAEDVVLREGETELGRPPQVPDDLRYLSAEDRAKLRLLEEEAAARELAEAELLIASDPSGLGWLGWFGSPLALTFLA